MSHRSLAAGFFTHLVMAFAMLVLAESAIAQAAVAPAPAGVIRDSTRAFIERHIRELTKPAWAGRGTSQPGSDSAAEYLAAQYREMQIMAASPATACDPAGECTRSYLQLVPIPDPVIRDAGFAYGVRAHNVIAAVPGTDPALSAQWIIVGAHYDHVGTTGVGSRDQDFPKRPHLGADDNASGTAAVLAIAKRIADIPLRRPVMFIHFGAEELGLIGSMHFVASAPALVDSAVAMVNLDMVGRLRQRELDVLALATSPDWGPLVTEAGKASGVRIKPVFEVSGGSDHLPFAAMRVPVTHLHTGLHVDWHTRRDTMEKVDLAGIARVVEFTEHLIRAVGDRDARLARVP